MRVASKFMLGSALALLAVGAAAGQSVTAPSANTATDPATVVRQTSNKIISELNTHETELKKDPQIAEKLVREYLLPNFDFEFTSQLVLGRYWRMATSQQRKEFEQAFLHYLVMTYAKGLENYRGAKVQVLPFRGDVSQEFVTVRTRVDTPDHEPMEIDYALRKTSDGWKAFDVKIAGVSYVQTYRNEFQSEIQRTSLAALIKRLQHAQTPKSLTAMKAASARG